MIDKIMDLYSDYLICSFNQATATGMSAALNHEISHDKITRKLRGPVNKSADLWRTVKPYVRKMESAEGVLIIDDTISEKPYSDENELVSWHFDHTKGHSVKGINLLTTLYLSQEQALPVAFELVKKTEVYIDEKTKKTKRRSPISKNEIYRQMLNECAKHQIPFKYVLNDVWFASGENMNYVHHTLKKAFVMPLKSNRKLALSMKDKQDGKYVNVSDIDIKGNTVMTVYLEGVSFPLQLVKQVFKNKDGSTGVLYLVTDDMTLTYDAMTSLYQKRWTIEPYHKSLKQNAALERSPAHTVNTQSNHIFASLCSYIKLEHLKFDTKLNHFALKSRLYLQAVKSAFSVLADWKPISLADSSA